MSIHPLRTIRNTSSFKPIEKQIPLSQRIWNAVAHFFHWIAAKISEALCFIRAKFATDISFLRNGIHDTQKVLAKIDPKGLDSFNEDLEYSGEGMTVAVLEAALRTYIFGTSSYVPTFLKKWEAALDDPLPARFGGGRPSVNRQVDYTERLNSLRTSFQALPDPIKEILIESFQCQPSQFDYSPQAKAIITGLNEMTYRLSQNNAVLFDRLLKVQKIFYPE